MKKYTFVLILLLSMLTLAACKDEEKVPKYEDEGTNTNQIAQKDSSEKNKAVNGENTEVKDGSASEYYQLPILTVVKDGSSRVMKENESALVYELTEDVEWSIVPEENFESDYVIMDNMNVLFEFNSKTNVLKDKNNDIYIKLHNELAMVLLLALDGEL